MDAVTQGVVTSLGDAYVALMTAYLAVLKRSAEQEQEAAQLRADFAQYQCAHQDGSVAQALQGIPPPEPEA